MPRATPLPPDERRAALIAATEPLLEHFGREVSTRRIAEAAGVAEGTIFRVFPTKEALIDAVCDQVVDLDPVCGEIRGLDPGADLETRLTTAVAILQRRLRRIFSLFHALHSGLQPPVDAAGLRAKQAGEMQRLNAALVELIEPDADRLRVPVAQAAKAVRLLTLAMTHPMLGESRPHEPQEIVDLVLHGIVRPPDVALPNGAPAC